MNHAPDKKSSAQTALREMIEGFKATRLVFVAAELGIADLLKDGPKHYARLADACGAHPRALYRLMRALASLGIFTQSNGDCFELNALAECLCRDSPGSLRTRAIFIGSQHYHAWGQLLHSVKTGETAFDHLHGMNVWQYRAQNAMAREVFDEAMTGRADQFARAVIQAYDFTRFATVVDVGGGRGTLLTAILRANPSVRGILFDLEEAIPSGKDLVQIEGLAERCEFVAGNFLDQMVGGGDVYILSRVIHNWDDTSSLQILKNCNRVMKKDHKLLIIERVIDPGNPSAEATLADINMMVMNGGCERTLSEYQALLNASGFELTNDIPLHSLAHIVEARLA